MNSEFSDDMDILSLERELQSLTPIAPRRELVQAIKARMEPVPRLVQPAPARVITFPWRRMVAPAAAAAAAVAVMNMEGVRRGPKTTPAEAANEPAPAIKWEPMPMLPQYRALLDQGYVLTSDMEFIPPGLANLFPGHVWRSSLSPSATRASFPPDRFIVPAGYGSPAMNMQWK